MLLRVKKTIMITPKEIDRVSAAFPTSTEGYLPEFSEIPEEFRRGRGTKWDKIFNKWMFSGLPDGTEFLPVEGIDPKLAVQHIRYCMASFHPKHEHKEAGCAYLMSLWFEDIKIPESPKEQP